MDDGSPVEGATAISQEHSVIYDVETDRNDKEKKERKEMKENVLIEWRYPYGALTDEFDIQ